MTLQQIKDKNLEMVMKEIGYDSLYPIQKQAISNGLLEGKNLLITSPTASGKTLIAIMAAVKALEKNKKVIYITPLKSLATEKYNDFLALDSVNFEEKILTSSINKNKDKKNKVKNNLIIKIATADYDSSGKDLLDANIVILTNEKLDALIRNNTEMLSNVGVFIIDEIHLISDKDRGPTLEMMITKIKKFYKESQILALSATVSNSVEISEWLDCKLIESDWRPTNLIEGVYDQGVIRTNDNQRFKINRYSSISSESIDVALDSIEKGGQVIIFAETRKRAASLAARSAESVFKLLNKEQIKKATKISSTFLKISNDTELTKNLAKLVSKGVGFHHAGLDPETRKILEESFKEGIVKLLVSTPTLAAGVNLPARRVILASVLRYDFDYGSNVPISILEYKQLCGRAGRPKYDTFGESIIITESGMNSDDLYDHYVLGTPEPITSKLFSEKALRFHLLSTISTVPGIKKTELYEIFLDTLFGRKSRKSTIIFKLDTALESLEEWGLVKSKKERYLSTEFGKKTSTLYLDPLSAVEFRNAINLIPKVHIKNDIDMTESIDYENLEIRFLHLITECYDFYPKLSLRKKDLDNFYDIIRRHSENLLLEIDEYNCSRSFLALYEWINETNDRNLSDKLGVEPGDMYKISESGNWLSYSLYEFAKLFNRGDLLPILANLKIRIKYGVKKELIPIIKIEGIGRIRARTLYDAGIKDIITLRATPEEKLSHISKIGPITAKKIKNSLK